MKPKEKAEQLVKRYTTLINYDFLSDLRWHDPNSKSRGLVVKTDAKLCALACVEFIVEQNNVLIKGTGTGTNNYWKEVIKEIKKL